MKTQELLFMPFVLASLLACASNVAYAQSTFRDGRAFPNIVLPSLKNGQPDSIGNYRGKKLILHIFASW